MTDLSAKSSPLRTNSAGSVGKAGGINGSDESGLSKHRISQFSDGDFVMIEPEDPKTPSAAQEQAASA